MAPQEPIRKRPPGPAREIPDKLYFRIGEVAKLCEVPAYVLRFWESEFPQLKPNKGGTGQRLYRRRDVEMALRIKTLLYDEGYTIPGARQAFKTELRSTRESTPPEPGSDVQPGQTVDLQHMVDLQKELREILALLSKPATSRSAVQSIRAIRPPEPVPAMPPLVPFPKPKLHTMKPKDSLSDAFVNGLFDDLPPLK